MSEFLSLLNNASTQWGTWMLRASVSGGSAILLVWALCRIFPKMPPTGRPWLWRAAFCKLLLAFFWQASVTLPVLPVPVTPSLHQLPASEPTVFPVGRIQDSRDAGFPNSGIPLAPLPDNAKGGTQERLRSDFVGSHKRPITSGGMTQRVGAIPPHQPSAFPTLSWASVALGCWLLGIAFCAERGLKAWRATRRLVAESQPLDEPRTLAVLAALREHFGLAHAPELRCCPGVSGLALTGVLKPTILLPSDWLASAEVDMELMLAHELAHQKRRDLAWNWLLLIGQTLFWFHPLVWLGAREWQTAQEIACDALAVRSTSTPVATYGAMLMKIALSPRVTGPETLFMVGVGERYATLHRRLSAMKHFTARAESGRAVLLCGALGLGLLVPWRVTARPIADAPPKGEDAKVEIPTALTGAQTSKASDPPLPDSRIQASRRAEKGQAVTGAFLQDAVGRPIQGATVVINADMLLGSDATLVTMQTDRLGLAKFRVPPPPSGVRFRAWAIIHAPGYALTQRRLEEGSYAVVRPEPDSTVRGTLTDAQGRPRRDVAVQLLSVQQGNDDVLLSSSAGRWLFVLPPLERKFTVRSDGRGIWTMSGLPQNGRATFEIVDPRFYAQRFTVLLSAGGATSPPRQVFAGATVAGRIRSPDGKPVAGMTVYAGGPSSSRSTTTGADGSYQVAGLGTTTARVLVQDPARSWVASVVRGLRTQLGAVTRVPDIILTRGSLLQGHVVNAVTGVAVPGASLTAHFDSVKDAYGNGNFAFANSDAQGRYALRVLPGSGTLEVRDYMPAGAGHLPQDHLPYTIGNGQRATLTIRMTPALELSGTAHDEAGQVARDAVIWVQTTGHIPRSMSSEFPAKVVDGRWRVTGLPRTTVKLKGHGSWEVVSPQRLTLPVTGPISVTLRRVDLSSLSGRVLTPEGRPLAEAEVTLFLSLDTPIDGIQPMRVLTDAQGRFILHNLRADTRVRVRVRKIGYDLVSGGQVSRQSDKLVVSDVVLKSVPDQERLEPLPVSAEPQTLRGQSGFTQVFSAAFSPDNRVLALGSRRMLVGAEPNNNLSEITLWNARDKTIFKTLKHGQGRRPTQVYVAFSPDGKTLASASETQVKLWDLATGQCQRTQKVTDQDILSIAFTGQKGALSVATASRELVWDSESGKLLSSHVRDRRPDVFSPDKTLFARTGADRVALYDADSRRLRPLEEVPYPVHWIAFSPDEKLLVGARAAGVVRRGVRFQSANGSTTKILSDEESDNEETLWIWDVRTGKLLQSFAKHSWGVNAITFSSDGKWLVSVSDDGTAKLWRINVS